MDEIKQKTFELIAVYKQHMRYDGEAMDGDQVDDFVELVKMITNINEGNL